MVEKCFSINSSFEFMNTYQIVFSAQGYPIVDLLVNIKFKNKVISSGSASDGSPKTAYERAVSDAWNKLPHMRNRRPAKKTLWGECVETR
jgi:hypothetical protein